MRYSSDDIYTDGYISHMFGSEGATAYFARLLHVNLRTLSLTPEWPSMFLICNPQVPHAYPFTTIRGHPAWLLDCAIRLVGTVVQQRIWAPPNEAQRHAHAPLNMPIFFMPNDGVTLGLPIVSATAGDYVPLRGAGTPAPVGEFSRTFIRINVSARFPRLPCQCVAHTLCPEVELTVLTSCILVARLQRMEYPDHD